MFNLTLVTFELMNLTAAVNHNFVVFQGHTETMPFSIGAAAYNATNSTSEAWFPVVEVLSSPTQGTLHAIGRVDQQSLAEGVVLQVDEFGQTEVVYSVLNRTAFTLPDRTADQQPLDDIKVDSFEFRMLALNTSTLEVLATSDPVVQPITVLNINDRPTLTVPPVANITDRSSLLGRNWYVVDNIFVDDSLDRNVDLIRVDLWALNGTISLESDVLHLADFSNCAIRQYSDWSCRGRGKKDRNMTFIATPEHANEILNHIEYLPFHKDIEDVISVRVHDGVGDACLAPEEHLLYGNDVLSVHNGCYTLEATIDVPTPLDARGGHEPAIRIPLFAILFWVFVISLFVGVCGLILNWCYKFCCCCLHNSKLKKNKKNKKHKMKSKNKKNTKSNNGARYNTEVGSIPVAPVPSIPWGPNNRIGYDNERLVSVKPLPKITREYVRRVPHNMETWNASGLPVPHIPMDYNNTLRYNMEMSSNSGMAPVSTPKEVPMEYWAHCV